eukprot:Phypoly_transcript_30996.p1 GENE.Phypoly_transcript_30996~~Phypoly_transcript_30996.p1  ORF type:complete len:105 (+),score=5.56 Phypoly_transcript_30996:38-316(+)
MNANPSMNQPIDPSVLEDCWRDRPYIWRVDLREYVRRTGKSQDFLVKKSRRGCVKCGRNWGECTRGWYEKDPRKLKKDTFAHFYCDVYETYD